MRNTATSTAPTRTLLVALLAATTWCAQADPASVRAALLESALASSPEYTLSIVDDAGRPVALFADLNSDGREDVAMIAVTAGPRVPTRERILADQSRLYANDVVEPVFILETYLEGQQAVVTVDLGKRIVWTGFELVELGAEATAVRVDFRSRAGTSTELVVFQPRGVSRFAFETNRNERGMLADVNADGVTDILTAVRTPEAGRGYETFLELHQLSPSGYRRSASFPVVRAVNDFLAGAAREMQAEAWEALANRFSGDGGPEGLAAAFPVVLEEDGEGAIVDADAAGDTRFDYPETGNDIERVVFPTLADNPFPVPFVGERFRLVFRVECCGVPARFFEATVRLDENPFDASALAFLTDAGTGQ